MYHAVWLNVHSLEIPVHSLRKKLHRMTFSQNLKVLFTYSACKLRISKEMFVVFACSLRLIPGLVSFGEEKDWAQGHSYRFCIEQNSEGLGRHILVECIQLCNWLGISFLFPSLYYSSLKGIWMSANGIFQQNILLESLRNSRRTDTYQVKIQVNQKKCWTSIWYRLHAKQCY